MISQRWMARAMGLVFITFFATVSLAQTVDRLGVMGDSLSDEYFEQTYNYARSWTELLVDERGLSLGPTAAQAGQPGGTWGEPRRTGYEDNWARYGATTDHALATGQHIGVADGAVNRGVSHVVLYIGANDFSPWSSPYAYDQIYHGNWSQVQIETWIDSRIANLEMMLDVVEPTGASLVILDIFDLSVIPFIHQGGYPDPVRREAAAMAVDQFGAEIRNLAKVRVAVFLDTFDLARAIFGTNLAPHSSLLVGNVAIDLDDTDLPGGGSPMAAFVHDGIHPNTVLQAIWANAVITALNLGYDTQIVPLSEQEMLAAAGIAYGGSDTLEQEIGPLEAFVTVFSEIFADGFESGDTSAWSAAVP